MKAYIQSQFKGMINDVPFSDKSNYATVEFFIRNLEDTLGIDISSDEFTQSLKFAIEEVEQKTNPFSRDEMEEVTYRVIQSCKSLSDFYLLANEYDDKYTSYARDFNLRCENHEFTPMKKDVVYEFVDRKFILAKDLDYISTDEPVLDFRYKLENGAWSDNKAHTMNEIISYYGREELEDFSKKEQIKNFLKEVDYKDIGLGVMTYSDFEDMQQIYNKEPANPIEEQQYIEVVRKYQLEQQEVYFGYDLTTNKVNKVIPYEEFSLDYPQAGNKDYLAGYITAISSIPRKDAIALLAPSTLKQFDSVYPKLYKENRLVKQIGKKHNREGLER